MLTKLRPIEFLYFYRIISWENKITAIRPLGYAFLGYLVAGHWVFLPILINTLAIIGLLMFAYSINDYYDFKNIGERNFLGTKIKEGNIGGKKAFVYCFLPLIFIVPLIFINNFFQVDILSIPLFLTGFLLTFSYLVPIFEFKKRKFLGFFILPLSTSLLFLQSFTLLGEFNLSIFFLTVLIFIFHCYVEILHVLEDSFAKREVQKIGREESIKWLRRIPFISLILSLAFSFYNLIFLVTFIFSFVRLIALKNFRIEDIWRIRRNLFLPQWSLYEFLIYGIFGMFHMF